MPAPVSRTVDALGVREVGNRKSERAAMVPDSVKADDGRIFGSGRGAV